MASPPVVDLESLLEPIPGENPSGIEIRFEKIFDQIEKARFSDDESLTQGEWGKEFKRADWDTVINLSLHVLKDKSKDLSVAARLTEGLTHKFGFAGLRDGLKVMMGIQETFWESFHPVIEDDDLETRFGPYQFADNTNILPLVVRQIPLATGKNQRVFTYSDYERIQFYASKDGGELDYQAADITDALTKTPWIGVQEHQAGDLDACIETLKEFNASIDRRYGRDAPTFGNLEKILETCYDFLRKYYEPKRKTPPGPNANISTNTTPTPNRKPVIREISGQDDEETSGADAGIEAGDESAPLTSAEAAVARILGAARFLRDRDPRDPLPYLIVRAVGVSELYAQAETASDFQPRAPQRNFRRSLRQSVLNVDAEGTLALTESVLGQTDAWAWLDAQRHAIQTLEHQGRLGAARALKAALRAVLQDFPNLPETLLDDDTPAANPITRAWLTQDVLNPAPFFNTPSDDSQGEHDHDS